MVNRVGFEPTPLARLRSGRMSGDGRLPERSALDRSAICPVLLLSRAPLLRCVWPGRWWCRARGRGDDGYCREGLTRAVVCNDMTAGTPKSSWDHQERRGKRCRGCQLSGYKTCDSPRESPPRGFLPMLTPTWAEIMTQHHPQLHVWTHTVVSTNYYIQHR